MLRHSTNLLAVPDDASQKNWINQSITNRKDFSMKNSNIDIGRRYTPPMIECLDSANACNIILAKLEKRAKAYVKSSKEIVNRSKTTENPEDLKLLIELEKSVKDNIELLKIAKANVMERKETFASESEEDIKAHTFEECDW